MLSHVGFELLNPHTQYNIKQERNRIYHCAVDLNIYETLNGFNVIVTVAGFLNPELFFQITIHT